MKTNALLMIVVASLLCPALRAQETWSVATSPTSQNLWSVTWGGGRFVAVGEAGTILTSPDGTTWSSRASGFSSTWLVAVGYGAGIWNVVGDNGLILTSTDTLTWAPRTSGTTARLNGVAYGGGRWMVVAESGQLLTSTDSIAWTALSPSTDRLRGILYAYGQFVITGDNGLMRTTIDATDYAANVLPGGFFVESVAYGRRAFVAVGEQGYAITSTDAVTWTRLASGTTVYLRGVTFFNGQFISVGAGGAIVTTPSPDTAWTARNSGSTAVLTAVAAGDSAAITVGLAGTILRSAPLAASPVITTAPVSSLGVAGDNVLFSVTATGSPPLAYQWLFNGQPLAGQTSERLFLPNVQAAQAGSYAVSVTNSLGSATSSAATLQLAASTTPTAIVDATFAPTPVLSSATISAAVEQTDGKLIIGGANFFVTAGVSPFALARLNLDGSLDSTFNIGSGLSGGGTVTVTNLVAQPDGRVLVAGTFQSINGNARTNLARLNADGSLDTTFTAAASAVSLPAVKIALQPDGKILVLNGTQLFRLNADGTSDASFVGVTNGFVTSFFVPLINGQTLVGSPTTIRRLNSDGSIDNAFSAILAPIFATVFQGLKNAPDGKIILELLFSPTVTGQSITLSRLNSDGTSDPTWHSVVVNSGPRGSILYSDTIDPNGNILLSTTGTPLVTPPTRLVVRYKPDASRDYTFDARTGPNGNVTTIYPLRDGRVIVAGSFTTFDGVARPSLARLVAANAPAVQMPTIVSVTPEAASVLPGAPVTLTVSAAGSGPLAYAWNNVVPSAQSANATVSMPTNVSGTYTATVTVTNRAGSITSAPVRIVVAPSAPILTAPPAGIAASAGRTAVFTVTAAGSAPFTYQWFRGATLVGTGSTLTLARITAADAGDYTIVVTNSLGSTRSLAVSLTVDGAARLANISTRASVGAGERTLIAGFVITGATTKTVLVRGIGPGLATFGLAGLLPDPKITLYDGAGLVIASNDNFNSAITPSGLVPGVGGFPLTNGSDGALVATLAPGNYTAQITDVAGRPGMALVEVYEADSNTNRLSNLSSRAFVGTGASVAIGGISVQGEKSRQYLIRGVGPGLTAFGLTSALADPVLALTTSAGATIATNDDWTATVNAAEIVAVTAKVGAFALAPASKDSALLVTLAPGNYTALVSGAGDTTGVALVEVYEVP